MLIKTNTGIELGGATSQPNITQGITLIPANNTVKVQYEFDCMLNTGLYFMNAGVRGLIAGEDTYLHRVLDLVAFRVLPISDNTSTGVIDFKCTPKIEILSNLQKASNL
jgi:lipopolysaccharide transport system ATP-binding protein